VRLALFAAGEAAPRRLRSAHLESAATTALAAFLDEGPAPTVVAHRIVHGGTAPPTTRRLDAATIAAIDRASPLAPLHNPASLAWVKACEQRLPGTPAVAVFDSGFFAELPAVAATYALPAPLRQRWNLRRLGFHGLAHRSMFEALRTVSTRHARVISFQLGSGCSAAALRDGRPVDTSMGLTPLEGLVMATRCGDLDPGVLLFLMTEGGLPARELAHVLDHRSGLTGLAGTGDLRRLLETDSDEARLAVDVHAYRARKYLGAYLAALGGCDAVIIGGGAGEKAPELRRRILTGLDELGLVLDADRNATARPPDRISADESRTDIWVLPTDEESVLAAEAVAWQAREDGA
jgi:acetate kinase